MASPSPRQEPGRPRLQRAFEDIDDLFARMLVPDERNVRAYFDSVLNDLASRDAEIVLLEIRPIDPREFHDHDADLLSRWISAAT
jgi:hypothetical protein